MVPGFDTGRYELGRLISYISIYHLFAERIISYRFLSSNRAAGVFVFGGEI